MAVPPWDATNDEVMQPCPNCDDNTRPKFHNSDWCNDCVIATLDEQDHERQAPIRPQIFRT